MNEYDEAMDFFMGTIKSFIEKVIPDRKIILVGHSFGGFLSAHLFARYP